MINLTGLESSEHDVASDGVLVLSGCGAALIKSFAHHEDGIGVITKFELNVRQFHHGNAHWVLELLLCQVLNLKLFLVDCTLVLKSGLLLPQLIKVSALDWIRSIHSSETCMDSQESFVLSVTTYEC